MSEVSTELDHRRSLGLRFAALSDVGRVRRDNQDSGYAGPHLLAVADGVGGAARGDLASTTAIQQLRPLDELEVGPDALDRLTGAINLTHSRLNELVAENPELDGTSTTTTAALFDGTSLNLAHVGDSRGYLLRDGTLEQLTKDHTFVQSLVDDGRITEDEARVHPHRNLILRAVDGVHEPEPDAFVVPLQPGDRILLCSDGCSGVLSSEEMAELLCADPLDRTAPALVSAALDAGSSDNVTVIVAEVVDADDAPSGPAPIVVGAVAGEGRPSSWSLRRRRTEEPPTDPEALRYAPLPPRRFVWVRRLAILGVLVALIVVGCVAAYSWSQSRYYVGAQGDRVAVFQGVDWQVPGLQMHHVVQVSALPLAALGDYDASQVRDGIPADSRSEALAKVRSLSARSCPSPTPTPTSSPSKKATSKAASVPRHHRSGTAHRSPSASPTHRATHHPTHRPSPTHSPSPSPTPSPSNPCGGA